MEMRILPASEFELNREVEYGSPEQNETVRRIIEEVRQDGDAALLRMAEQFDRVKSLSFASATKRSRRRTHRSTPSSWRRCVKQPPTFVRFMRSRNARRGWICSRTAACWAKSSDR